MRVGPLQKSAIRCEAWRPTSGYDWKTGWSGRRDLNPRRPPWQSAEYLNDNNALPGFPST